VLVCSDESGKLSKEEFMALPDLGQNPLVERVIAIFDSDGDGEIDFEGTVRLGVVWCGEVFSERERGGNGSCRCFLFYFLVLLFWFGFFGALLDISSVVGGLHFGRPQLQLLTSQSSIARVCVCESVRVWGKVCVNVFVFVCLCLCVSL
jgi:hypothetical protein